MRLVLTAMGTRGDVQPLLVLGVALKARGDAVTLAVPETFRTWVVAHGLEFVACGLDIEAFIAEHGVAMTHRPLRGASTAIAEVRKDVRRQFDTLAPLAKNADAIFSAGAHVSASSIALWARIPHRFLAYCPQILVSRFHPPPAFKSLARSGAFNALAWRGYRFLWNLALRKALDAEHRALGLPPVGDVWAHASSQAILASDPSLAPRPADVDVPQTGAVFYDDPAPLDAATEAFLAAGPAPAYVGFGSMADRDRAVTAKAIVSAARAAGARVILARGWAGLVAEGDDVHAIGDSPHARLFPRCAAIVHHGGAGTTSAAARSGVPQVVVPHLLDQFYWAHRVTALGAGPRSIPRASLTEKRLAEAIGHCLHDEAIHAAARRLGAAIHGDGLALTLRAMDDAAEARA